MSSACRPARCEGLNALQRSRELLLPQQLVRRRLPGGGAKDGLSNIGGGQLVSTSYVVAKQL